MASHSAILLSSPSTFALFASHRRYPSTNFISLQFSRSVRRPDLGLRCSVSTGKEDPETERSFTFRGDSDHVAHFSSVRARFEAMIRNAQDSVCEAIETVEGGPKFKEDVWCLPRGSVEVSRLLEDGNVWEQAEVIVAVKYGDMNPEAYRTSASEQNLSPRPFFTAGIKAVLHPRNPFAPTLHFNYRYFETEDVPGAPREWEFGGQTELSPAYLFEEDVKHFHSIQKQACDKFDPSFYPRFKKWCDDFFCIESRGERRGVGGIFFDGLNDYDEEMLLSFATECARSVVPAYIPIIEKRKDTPYSVLHKAWQQLRRERYVEFKLEKWGLKRKGGIDSELVPFPSNARWDYDIIPEEGTEEWKLLDACINPKDWI